MTGAAMRSYLVRLVIISALAAAGWRFIVRPLHARVQERDAMLQSMQQEVSAGNAHIQAQVTTPEAVISSLRRRADSLRETWSLSNDASRLYERFDALAHRYGVTIERIEPHAAGGNQRVPDPDDDVPVVSDLGYSIELIGTYDAVARFMRAVQGETGLVRIESFRIAPEAAGRGEPRVRASVRTMHFQISGGLAAFDAGEGGRP